MQMHRRKSSREEDVAEVVDLTESKSPPSQSNGVHSPPRTRVHSTPAQSPTTQFQSAPPPSAGPFRTGFAVNGIHQSSPLRSAFPISPGGHARSRSTSGPSMYSPALPSPLSESFSSSRLGPPASPLNIAFPTSDPVPNGSASPNQSRRHSRIHSRNLSVFFPRPGTLPHSVIAEDGVQEVEYNGDEEGILIPSASPGPQILSAPPPKRLGEGFSFGGRSSSSTTSPPPITPNSASSIGPSRRGHHHKHSLSHNFFSFLDPTDPQHQQQEHIPVPESPWNPISPFPQSAGPGATSFPQSAQRVDFGHDAQRLLSSPLPDTAATLSLPAIACSVVQFTLGAALWVSGQQHGSLGCTGLGYWVVFDAFGVALGHVLPTYLARGTTQSKTRRPYGNARVETVLLFAQAVYLIFSSVYVCKETVEHLLLSAGEGHHHHPGDETIKFFGIQFPTFLIFATLLSLITTGFTFNNNSKLVLVTGNHLPSVASLFRLSRSHPSVPYEPPISPIASLLTNPFTVFPVLFSAAVLAASMFLPPIQHRAFDLILAAVETIATFMVAYPAAVALGTVLLQTAPPRGLPGGRMEAFLRAMREVERHPQVLHLPAPHIWQLTPSSSTAGVDAHALVVTMELRVRGDLGDDDVLALTRWAWERCSAALNGGPGARETGGWVEADVTVGVVRG